MSEKKVRPLIQIYNEYFKCSNPKCHSVYHISNFNKDKFECRDCGEHSQVPKEVKQRKK